MNDDISIKSDLEGDTEMGMLEDFDSTELGFLTPAGDIDGIDEGAPQAAGFEVTLDAATEPVGAATRALAIAAVDAVDAAAALAQAGDVIDTPPEETRVPVARDARAGTLPGAFVERRVTVDDAAEALASADSTIERLASADSSIKFRAISDSMEAVDPPHARSATAEFWPPPGPVPAGAHGPRRKAQVFAAVKDETRDWLDSDQVTVVPSPDDV